MVIERVHAVNCYYQEFSTRNSSCEMAKLRSLSGPYVYIAHEGTTAPRAEYVAEEGQTIPCLVGR